MKTRRILDSHTRGEKRFTPWLLLDRLIEMISDLIIEAFHMVLVVRFAREQTPCRVLCNDGQFSLRVN